MPWICVAADLSGGPPPRSDRTGSDARLFPRGAVTLVQALERTTWV
jgi:hypothetical protein